MNTLGKILIEEEKVTLDWDDTEGYIINCDKSCSNCCRTYRVKLEDDEFEEFKKKHEGGVEKNCDFSRHGYLKKSYGKCVFLNIRRKCSIYEDRPLLCRTFPLRFEELVKTNNKIVLKIFYNPNECNASLIKSDSKKARELNKDIIKLVFSKYIYKN